MFAERGGGSIFKNMAKAFVSTVVDACDPSVTLTIDVNGCFIKIKETTCPLGQGMTHQDMLDFLKQCVAAVEFQISQSNG